MPAVQLHCPHCGGLFQIDDSLAGQHVGCPLCASVVAIPDLHPALAAGPPPPPPPEFAEAPPTDETYQLGCPNCGGLFQVTQAMGGQEISCPHCYTAVLLPDLGAPSPALPQGAPALQQGEYAPFPPEAPSPFVTAQYPPAPSVGMFTSELWNPHAPHGTPGEAWAPEATAQPMPYQPAPFQPAPFQPAPFQPAPFQPAAPTTEIAGEALDDLLPPGAVSRKAPEKQAGPRTGETKSSPVAKKNKTKKSELPAPAEPAANVEDLLPPGATPKPETPERRKAPAEVEDLLPPAAETAKRPLPLSDDEPAPAGRRAGNAADGSVLIPVEDGKVIALREPVKTVEVGGREIELRRLTPEEKERRRFRRNLLVAGFGLLFLIITMLIMNFAR